MRRGRPVSQRKKIKKSLGPDFLDPSDLGYQYLKDTYGPKCQYCDSPFGPKHDKYLSCEKCGSKAHLRCLSINGVEDLDIDTDAWLCEKCIVICDLCGLTAENEAMHLCCKCEGPFHVLCIKMFWENPIVSPQDKWICRPCKFKYEHDSLPKPRISEKANKNTVQKGDENNYLIANKESDLRDYCESSDTLAELKDKCLLENQNYVSENLLKTIESFSIHPNPQNWTAKDVETFIREIGFPEQAPLFSEQMIDGKSLLLLSRTDVLKNLSMKLGPALKIYAHINTLQGSDLDSISDSA